jgi:hypothetical protein
MEAVILLFLLWSVFRTKHRRSISFDISRKELENRAIKSGWVVTGRYKDITYFRTSAGKVAWISDSKATNHFLQFL